MYNLAIIVSNRDRPLSKGSVDDMRQMTLKKLHNVKNSSEWSKFLRFYLYFCHSVVFAYDLHPRVMEPLRNVRLLGLDASRQYQVTEINLMPGKASSLTCNGQQYSGDYLMKVGLPILTADQANSHVLELIAE